MKKKYIALIVILAVLAGATALELTMGSVSALAFDQMNYQYSSHVIIPPTTSNGSSMGGFYEINGTGRNFNMLLVLSGAEKTESPLDYTSDGLKIKGHIDTIKATPQTINYLWQKDLVNAMFNTIFNGNMNMTCAAWTGVSNFQNDGQNFNGTFFISGIYTDWTGGYTVTMSPDGRLAITADYVYYPKNKPDNSKPLHSVYYL